MKKLLIATAVGALVLTGCATNTPTMNQPITQQMHGDTPTSMAIIPTIPIMVLYQKPTPAIMMPMMPTLLHTTTLMPKKPCLTSPLLN